MASKSPYQQAYCGYNTNMKCVNVPEVMAIVTDSYEERFRLLPNYFGPCFYIVCLSVARLFESYKRILMKCFDGLVAAQGVVHKILVAIWLWYNRAAVVGEISQPADSAFLD